MNLRLSFLNASDSSEISKNISFRSLLWNVFEKADPLGGHTSLYLKKESKVNYELSVVDRNDQKNHPCRWSLTSSSSGRGMLIFTSRKSHGCRNPTAREWKMDMYRSWKNWHGWLQHWGLILHSCGISRKIENLAPWYLLKPVSAYKSLNDYLD